MSNREHAYNPESELIKNKTLVFDSAKDAVRFVKDFWQAVDSDTYERISNQPDDDYEPIKEQTVLDRTVIRSTFVNDELKFQVAIYRNNDKDPLSSKALNFLKSRDLI